MKFVKIVTEDNVKLDFIVDNLMISRQVVKKIWNYKE